MTQMALLGPIGLQEALIIVLAIALLFGAKQIPAFAKNLGEGIRSLKTSLKDADEVGKEIERKDR